MEKVDHFPQEVSHKFLLLSEEWWATLWRHDLDHFSVTGKLFRRFKRGWNMSSFFSLPYFLPPLFYKCIFWLCVFWVFLFPFNIVFPTKSSLCLVLFPLGRLTRKVPSSLHATTNISLPWRKIGHITLQAWTNLLASSSYSSGWQSTSRETCHLPLTVILTFIIHIYQKEIHCL